MKFIVQSDHKSLIPIINDKESKLSARWNRRLMFISEFDCTTEYIPGKDNKTADFLSRRNNSIRIGLPELKVLQENDKEVETWRKKLDINVDDGILTKISKNGAQTILFPRYCNKRQ